MHCRLFLWLPEELVGLATDDDAARPAHASPGRSVQPASGTSGWEIAPDPVHRDFEVVHVPTPGLHHKISVFSDPDPGKS